MNKELRMTSVEVSEVINQFRELEQNKSKLSHSDLMKKIRKELESLQSLGIVDEGNISLVDYRDTKGELRPCYSLNRDGIVQICMSESTLVRYKMIEYINKLEQELLKYQLPQTYKEALIEIVAQLEKNEQLALENTELKTEVIHKENVIIGLVDDIDLQTKRQRLNDVMRYKFTSGKNQSEKWNLLYSEFEGKYHLNLKLRMERDNATVKPKYKNKLDYIDRGLGMIPQTYELACKLFENDVEKLKKEWFDVVGNKI